MDAKADRSQLPSAVKKQEAGGKTKMDVNWVHSKATTI